MASRHFFGGQKPLQGVPAPAQGLQVTPHGRQKRLSDRLMTTEECRVYLNLGSLDAVYRMVREYGLPRIAVGPVFRFRVSEVEGWLEAQRPAAPLRAVR